MHIKNGNVYIQNGELIFDPLGTIASKIYRANSNLRIDAVANLRLRTGEDYNITFGNSDGEYARFDGTVQGLGIGTTAPTSKLTIIDDESAVSANSIRIDKDYSTTTGTIGAMDIDITRANAGAIQGINLNVDSNGDGSGIVNGFDMTVNSINTTAQTEGLDIHVKRSSGTGTTPTIGFRVQSENTSTNGSVYGALTEVCGSGTGTKYSIYATTKAACSNGGNYYAGYFNGDVFTTGSYLPSDATLKKNFKNESSVLEKLRKLDVVNYEYDKAKYHFMELPEGRQTGLIAQNLAVHFPELVKEMVHPAAIPDMVEVGQEEARDETRFQGVNYTGMVPYLVKGVQELAIESETYQAEIDDLKNENEELRNELEKIKGMIAQLQGCCVDKTKNDANSSMSIELQSAQTLDVAFLDQNAPNPFYEQTVISYYLPEDFQKAEMSFSDLKGQVIKSVSLQNAGIGTISISARELSIGTYFYTLVIDGKVIDTKKMILTK